MPVAKHIFEELEWEGGGEAPNDAVLLAARCFEALLEVRDGQILQEMLVGTLEKIQPAVAAKKGLIRRIYRQLRLEEAQLAKLESVRWLSAILCGPSAGASRGTAEELREALGEQDAHGASPCDEEHEVDDACPEDADGAEESDPEEDDEADHACPEDVVCWQVRECLAPENAEGAKANPSDEELRVGDREAAPRTEPSAYDEAFDYQGAQEDGEDADADAGQTAAAFEHGRISFISKEALKLLTHNDCEVSPRRLVPQPSLGRLILGQHPASARNLLPAQGPPPHSFSSVCVFGPHHSCTSAMVRELQRFFDVAVRNEHRSDNPSLWKHRHFQEAPPLDDETFSICIIKDPAFWIQSLARDPDEGTFYEIEPVKVDDEEYDGEEVQFSCRVEEPRGVEQLFSPVLFDCSNLFADAVDLWEASVNNYFTEEFFPMQRTAVVRCEDLLFCFGDVIRALAQRGLKVREDVQLDDRCAIQPVQESAKDSSHPECTRRPRSELLKYYGDPSNRFVGLSPEQVRRLQWTYAEAGPLLGYEHEWPDCWSSVT